MMAAYNLLIISVAESTQIDPFLLQILIQRSIKVY
jgi:hypothetical protein